MAKRDERAYLQGSVTEEQQNQPAYENPPGGGSFVCGLR